MAKEHEITIHIDKKMYKVQGPTMNGAQIRAVPMPPIGSDRDLFLVVPGQKDDRKIGDAEIVELKEGMHFYSAPTTINPGAQSCNSQKRTKPI